MTQVCHEVKNVPELSSQESLESTCDYNKELYFALPLSANQHKNLNLQEQLLKIQLKA